MLVQGKYSFVFAIVCSYEIDFYGSQSWNTNVDCEQSLQVKMAFFSLLLSVIYVARTQW